MQASDKRHEDLVKLISGEKCKWFSIGYMIAKGGSKRELSEEKIREIDKESMAAFIELYDVIMENWSES